MARFKQYSYSQGKFIPVQFDKQILPNTFEYAVRYLIDNEIDLSVFRDRYKNDEVGAPAYDPAILLKIVLYAYSKGIVSSRKIAQCCRENIIFMALSADTRPHFTTIASFISSLDKEVVHLFRDILLVCDQMGLIGKEMFAVDGCKISSNASKEWSGTKEEFDKKCSKLEEAISRMIERHRDLDKQEKEPELVAREQRYVEKLRSQVRKIRKWMGENEDKPGRGGGIRKSNITDNDSAKMKSSRGVIQGYNGLAMVDDKHQVIVHGEAFGEGQEQYLLQPMVEGTRKMLSSIDADDFCKIKLLADAGFHTAKTAKYVFEEGIDAYMADRNFRKRDPRFKDRDRYKTRARKERKSRWFTPRDFEVDLEKETCICPAGKSLYVKNRNFVTSKGYKAVAFMAKKSDCKKCALKKRCLRNPDKTPARQVHIFYGKKKCAGNPFIERMKSKIDSVVGRQIYSKRLGIVEPVFAHITSALGLNRFTLRGKAKVNIQWLLFCVVHNMKKIHRYGLEFT